MSTPNHSHQEQQPPPITAEIFQRAGKIGLGSVEFADKMARGITSLPVENYTDHISQVEEDNLGLMLDAEMRVGKRLFTESPDRLSRFYRGVESLDPPQSLHHMLGANNTRGLVRNAVMEDGNPRGRVNFFQWYNGAVAEKQARFDREQLPMYLGVYESRLWQAEEDQVVAAGVTDRFAQMVADNKLHITFTDAVSLADSLADVLHFRNGEKVLRMGNVETADEERFEHRLTHELDHTIEGTSKDDDEQDASVMKRQEMGLGRVFGKGLIANSIKEATNELLADSMIHGNIDETNPLMPARAHSEDYFIDQYLLSTICASGVRPIDPRVLTRAATADGEPNTTPELLEVPKVLEVAYPGLKVMERIQNFEAEPHEPYRDAIMRFAEDIVKDAALLPQKRGQNKEPTASEKVA